MRFRCIQTHRGQFPLRLMCRVLEVSVSGFYAWRDRGPGSRQLQDRQIAARIRAIYTRSRRTYGSPRIRVSLRNEGIRCSRKRVARLMRTEGMCARRRRRFRAAQLTPAYMAGNVLSRRFTVPLPNHVWTADVTYIPTRQGWLYLAVVMDLASRRIVGWAMRTSADQQLTADALMMAIKQRNPPRGMLHHSDRGVQYSAAGYQALLQKHGLNCSMSRTGNCWDNAVAESFFSTLKSELVNRCTFSSPAQARPHVFEYIEGWYNRQRLHSTLDYLSPMQYEMKLGQES